jgi:tetratricopeptide (TPR) repeat protein
MSRSPQGVVGPLMLVVALLWLAPAVVQAQGSSAVYELVEQGRQALVADKYADSLAALRKAIARPEFVSSDPGLQYFAYYLASFAAGGVGNDKAAYDYAVSATRFNDADGDTWIRRAGMAAQLDQWDDAALSLLTTAQKYPKALVPDMYHGRLVHSVVRELGKKPGLHKQRLELLNALFDAGFKASYNTEPGWLWQLLATDALDRKDMKRAREVTRRINDPSVLLNMRIDKRYDALVAEDAKAFDLTTAAERHARQYKKAMSDNPKDLGATVQYGYALYTLGKFDELLALADGVITQVEKSSRPEGLYEDIDDNLNWIYNHKATALRALGKWEEAAAVLAGWERNPRNRDDKVSQAINLGFFYNELGRPDDALKAVNGVEDKGVSDYGRIQFQFVRFQAYQQLGKASEAREVATWLLEHKADDMETAQGTLLESGDVDGAAALLISRLKDAEERSSVLSEIQMYAQTPRTERQKKLDAQREALLTRADVVAAVAEYGRREKLPIYSLEY